MSVDEYWVTAGYTASYSRGGDGGAGTGAPDRVGKVYRGSTAPGSGGDTGEAAAGTELEDLLVTDEVAGCEDVAEKDPMRRRTPVVLAGVEFHVENRHDRRFYALVIFCL